MSVKDNFTGCGEIFIGALIYEYKTWYWEKWHWRLWWYRLCLSWVAAVHSWDNSCRNVCAFICTYSRVRYMVFLLNVACQSIKTIRDGMVMWCHLYAIRGTTPFLVSHWLTQLKRGNVIFLVTRNLVFWSSVTCLCNPFTGPEHTVWSLFLCTLTKLLLSPAHTVYLWSQPSAKVPFYSLCSCHAPFVWIRL